MDREDWEVDFEVEPDWWSIFAKSFLRVVIFFWILSAVALFVFMYFVRQ